MNEPHLRYLESPLLSGEIFHQSWAARGMAIGDLDNDGRIDFVVTSIDGPAWVIHNETPEQNHWITLKLEGVQSNRDGIGAQVKISTTAGDQSAVTTASSYQSFSDKRVHFGLGAATSISRIEIRWPTGIRQVLSDVKADQILNAKEARSTQK
jgi:hypothetical protein